MNAQPDEPTVSVDQSELATATPVQSARAQLDSLAPSWTPSELSKAPPANRFEAPTRPREFANQFVGETLSFSERRAGRDFFTNPSGDVVVSADASRGLWSVLRKPTELAPGAVAFASSRAEAAAHAMFRSVGAPEAEKGEVINADLATGFPGGAPTVIARHVRFHRQVNNLRVRGSLWMATFDLNGTPFRIEAKWPDFKLAKSAQLHSRAEALDAVAAPLAVLTSGSVGVGQVTVDLAYEQAANGTFEPVLSVSAFPKNGFGSPELIRYSLVSGLWSSAGTSASDPPSDG